MTDTVKTVDAAGLVDKTLDRNALRLVQTPQGFAFPALLEAHRRAAAAGRDDFTDDAALAEWAGMKVSVFAGEPGNIKITNADDFARAEAMQFARARRRAHRHRHRRACLRPGDHVTLGGIRIAHDRALIGHSDADVALHALVDAILGALAEGDIGAHFPPSDPQWRNASSDRFLAFAVERVTKRAAAASPISISPSCARRRASGRTATPCARASPRLPASRSSRVAVKATTSEKLGFTGRGEGIAAYATATVRLPWSAP